MAAGIRGDSLGSAISWLAHPASIAALVLLLVNDHVLKPLWPGFVTGKLSDVAGMLMFPALLAVLIALLAPRLPARALALGTLTATGMLFTAIKSGGYPLELAESAWSVLSGHPVTIVPDLSDLLAVPFLAVAYHVWRTSRTVTTHTARLTRAAILVPLGLLATMATSPAKYHLVLTVFEDDGVIYAGQDVISEGDDPKVTGYLSSTDHGLTFDYVTDKKQVPPRPAHQEACHGNTCYQTVPGELHVRESHDSGQTWSTAWQISGWEYDALRYDRDGITSPATELASLSLVVVETAKGHVVIVANGRDGLLRRSEDGTWTRIGIDGSGRVTPLRAKPDFTSLRLAAGLLVVGGVFYTWLLAATLHGPSGRLKWTFVILALSTLVINTFYLIPSHLAVYSWVVLGLLHAATLTAALMRLAEERRVRTVSPFWTVALVAITAVCLWWSASITLSPGSPLEFIVFEFGSGASDAVQHLTLALPALAGAAAAFFAGLFTHPTPRPISPPS